MEIFFMLKTQFTLISKKLLTNDVYELVYSCPDLERDPPKSGQYVLFQLLPWLNRAYSFASFSLGIQYPTFTLIIKRIPDGRGSPMICDAEIGTVFSGMISLGHFVLRDTPSSKCFIGTGTGFAPLYCQMLGSLTLMTPPSKTAFIFWVRSIADAFYESEIAGLGREFGNFTYIQYFSREDNLASQITSHELRDGYVTDWITRENISEYDEYYICGSPAMVKNAREKLETLGVLASQIFFEQF